MDRRLTSVPRLVKKDRTAEATGKQVRFLRSARYGKLRNGDKSEYWPKSLFNSRGYESNPPEPHGFAMLNLIVVTSCVE